MYFSCIIGKTSIIAAICRLYPVDEGRIFVGDLNINEISLKDLRASIAVIPQDPVLFQGTLRLASIWNDT